LRKGRPLSGEKTLKRDAPARPRTGRKSVREAGPSSPGQGGGDECANYGQHRNAFHKRRRDPIEGIGQSKAIGENLGPNSRRPDQHMVKSNSRRELNGLLLRTEGGTLD